MQQFRHINIFHIEACIFYFFCKPKYLTYFLLKQIYLQQVVLKKYIFLSTEFIILLLIPTISKKMQKALIYEAVDSLQYDLLFTGWIHMNDQSLRSCFCRVCSLKGKKNPLHSLWLSAQGDENTFHLYGFSVKGLGNKSNTHNTEETKNTIAD